MDVLVMFLVSFLSFEYVSFRGFFSSPFPPPLVPLCVTGPEVEGISPFVRLFRPP